jgi:hypothetical protein
LSTLATYLISVFFPALLLLEAHTPREAVKGVNGLLPIKPKEEELLDWQPDRPLTWEDYMVRPDPDSDAAASTTTYLAIEYNLKGQQFSYKIHSRFSCDKSWGLHKTEYILAHEQGHFDIAEVYARVLHKKMSEYRFDRQTYKKDLKKIYEDVIEAKEEMQNRYDKETNHSIYRARQAEWLETINQMLEKTRAFADY